MGFYKCDLFFEDGASGWSETMYHQDSFVNVEDEYNAALGALQRLAAKRQALLAKPAFIKALRVSNVDITKDSVLAPGDNWSRFDSTYSSDTPWQALLIRLGSGGSYWRPLYLRGIPDILFEDFALNKTTTPALAWFTAFEAWRQQVFSEGFRIRVASKNPSDAPERRITSMPLVAGTLSVSTAVAHGFVAGDTVVFYQRGFKPPLGRRQVQGVPDPLSFTLPYIGERDPLATLGRVKKVVVGFVAISNINYERITHRDTGRPFGGQRGRRGKKVC